MEPLLFLPFWAEERVRFWEPLLEYWLEGLLEPQLRLPWCFHPEPQSSLSSLSWFHQSLRESWSLSFQEPLPLDFPLGVRSSDEILAKGGKFLLSGAPDEPAAGVGFYVAPKALPLVQDFVPFSSRLAALILRTQPHPTILLTVYAPSMLQDAAQDLKRKQKFWETLPDYLLQLPRPATVLLAGDFNARVVKEDLADYSEYIGPAVLPTDSPFDESNPTPLPRKISRSSTMS